MANFTLLFEGLMAFVGPSLTAKAHVAVVDEPTMHRNPTIYVNSTRTDDILKGDTITFNVPSTGAATTDATFDARIPSLSKYITTGALDPNVKAATHPHAGVLAFIILPNGRLSAEGRMRSPAKFTKKDGTTEILCPAPQVRLTISTQNAAPMTMTISGPQRANAVTYVVNDGGIIGFSNGSTVPGMHFHEYSLLLTAGGAIGSIVPANGLCTLTGEIEQGGPPPVVDASMSAAEIFSVFRSPHGDCGPTGSP